MKSKSLYIHILTILLTIAAYAYLFYRLATFDNYAAVIDNFSNARGSEWLCIIGVLLLMPLNVGCEAWKWQVLMQDIEPMSSAEAQRQVYYGYVGAFVTPGRVGDYPARVLLLSNPSLWPTAVALGGVGTLAMYLVEVCLGVPASILLAQYETYIPWLSTLMVLLLMVLLIGALPVIFKRLARRQWRHIKLQLLINELAALAPRRFLKVVLISGLRYAIWMIQLTLALRFCGVILTPAQLLLTIPAYYLLLGIVPSLPAADIAVRGSLSLWIFGVFSPDTAGIAIAVALIWFCNTLLPMVVGTLVKKTNLQPILIN